LASIVGIEGMTTAEVAAEVAKGGKFVYFEYAFSILIMTFKRPSAIHFIRAGESASGKSIPYTLLTLVAGWWGFPWGPIYSFMALATNLGGGKDVTDRFTASLRGGSASG
jgi:hypothetical protein